MSSFRAYFVNAGRLVARILGLQRMIPGEIERGVRGLADDSELIFQSFAPRQSGRLARGIRAIVSGKHAIITAFARTPTTGYDYVGVTRFGHRQARIRPRSDRRPASVSATGRPRATGGRASLRFTMGGRVLYRKSVRGFRPKGDWAELARPNIEAAADDAAREIGERVAVRWGSPS